MGVAEKVFEAGAAWILLAMVYVVLAPACVVILAAVVMLVKAIFKVRNREATSC